MVTDNDIGSSIFTPAFRSERFSFRFGWRRAKRHAAQRHFGIDPTWRRTVGGGGTACGFAKGACGRGTGANARAVAYRSTAAVGQSGRQPTIGRAVAKGPASRVTDPKTVHRKGQEIFSCPDAYRLSCPRDGGVDHHLVIRHRHDRSETKIRPLVFNLKRKSNEIPGATDSDPDAVVSWDRRLRAAPAADRRGPFSCARIDCAASLAGNR